MPYKTLLLIIVLTFMAACTTSEKHQEKDFDEYEAIKKHNEYLRHTLKFRN